MELEQYFDDFRRKLIIRLPELWKSLDSLPDVCTVYACSDLHVDFPANREWLQALPVCTDPHSVLLVAGDVQHDLARLEDTLVALSFKYGRVFFIPGNHDLWALGQGPDSAAKFFSMLDMLERIDVEYLPAPLTRDGLTLHPLFSWHSPDLSDSFPMPSYFEESFDMACRWPRCINGNDNPRQSSLLHEIPAFFRELNAMTMAMLRELPGYTNRKNLQAITMSHFLPRLELYNGRMDLEKVMGDPLVDKQLRAAGSVLHVFGHSHLNVDTVVDGVRYVQHALGNHRTPQLLWRPIRIFSVVEKCLPKITSAPPLAVTLSHPDVPEPAVCAPPFDIHGSGR